MTDFYQKETRKAGKIHRCKICGWIIRKGQKHIRSISTDCGDFSHMRLHCACDDYLEAACRLAIYPEDGIYLDEINEYFEEAPEQITEYRDDLAEELARAEFPFESMDSLPLDPAKEKDVPY